MVIWLILKDSNGSTFVLSPVGGEGFNELGPLIVEDCTVVYAELTGTTGEEEPCST